MWLSDAHAGVQWRVLIFAALLLFHRYFYLLTPRLRHAHCLARFVAWLVTTGVTAGGCALYAGGIVFVSPSFMAGVRYAGALSKFCCRYCTFCAHSLTPCACILLTWPHYAAAVPF